MIYVYRILFCTAYILFRNHLLNRNFSIAVYPVPVPSAVAAPVQAYIAQPGQGLPPESDVTCTTVSFILKRAFFFLGILLIVFMHWFWCTDFNCQFGPKCYRGRAEESILPIRRDYLCQNTCNKGIWLCSIQNQVGHPVKLRIHLCSLPCISLSCMLISSSVD